MKYYVSKTDDAYFNLAMEEYLMKNIDEEIFYIYINSPSVIIGKNQNPYSEVGIDYLKKNNINLVRRLSGGGAVYHDHGNVNYAFIMPGHSKNLYEFKKYSMPIVNVLNDKWNLNVEFSGRNDLIIDGKKISGTAQYVVGNSLLHHGTLLYDVDFSQVKNILTPNKAKLETKGVKSIQSRVANLMDLEWEKVNRDEFVKILVDNISDDKEYIFTEKQLSEINKIADANKNSIKFILENNIQYQNQYVEYLPGFGTIEIYSNLKDGKISKLEIFGEYFFEKDFNDIKEKIKGVEYTKEGISKFVDSIPSFEKYFHKLSKEQLTKFILAEG